MARGRDCGAFSCLLVDIGGPRPLRAISSYVHGSGLHKESSSSKARKQASKQHSFTISQEVLLLEFLLCFGSQFGDYSSMVAGKDQ